MASASAKRNNAPARPQQAYHLSSYQEEDRIPWLEQQAADAAAEAAAYKGQLEARTEELAK